MTKYASSVTIVTMPVNYCLVPFKLLLLCVLVLLQLLKYFDAVGWAFGCKKLSGGCWHGDLSGARCRFSYGPAHATVSGFGMSWAI